MHSNVSTLAGQGVIPNGYPPADGAWRGKLGSRIQKRTIVRRILTSLTFTTLGVEPDRVGRF